MANRKGTKLANSNPVDDPKNVLRIVSTGNEADRDKIYAQTALRPHVQAGITIKQWSKKLGENDLTELVEELRSQSEIASSGNLSRGEAMLMAQAHTLDALFNDLARRAGSNVGEYLDAADRYMRLALKAQSQCRSTIETLAEIKNPRQVAFVRQANIANNQQVNNGNQPSGELSDTYAQAHAGAGKTENQPNELLEAQHGERLDIGTAGQTICGDQGMETVGAVNGAEDSSG